MNDDWRQVPLHELARVDRGASWSKAQEVTDGTGSPVIRIANVQPSGLDLKEVRSVVGMKVRDIERAQIGPHTLLMVGSNGNPERVGNVYQSDSNIEGMSLASFLVGIHSSDELTSKWLYYFLSSDHVQYLLTEATAGSTGLKNLSLEWLRRLEIPLPPLPVQRRIVDLMAHLDNQIANLRTERDAVEGDLRRIRNGLMLSGEPRRAGDVFEILIGRQRSPSRSSGPSMTPYLRAANVKDGRLDLSDVKEMDFDSVERDRFGLKSGDVLVSEGSGSAKAVGAAARWTGEIQGPICFQNTLLRYREVPGESVASFVYHWCRWAYESGAYMETATGTNILHIGSTRAVEMSVGWQAPGTQVLLCEVLDDHETTIVALDHEVQSLKKVREVMLADLLAGRLVVHERYDSLLDGVA